MSINTIDDVLARLEEHIAHARRERSRLAYFAVLYHGVTLKIKELILAGHFDDGARMERLDVAFASRYLDALDKYTRGLPVSRCWLAAFKAAEAWPPIALQHLLLGINAHINLDLGVAAAQVSPGDGLPALRKDFDAINNILCAMIDDVQDKLAVVSPWMTLLDRAGCRTDEEVLNFSINKARDAAWRVAEKLAPLGPAEIEAEIARLDHRVCVISHLVRYPTVKIRLVNFLVRLSEGNDVPRIIDALA